MKELAQVNIGNALWGGSNPIFNAGGKPLEGIGKLVSLFLNVAFVAAGVILLFFFVMGGIGMISSAGQNDPQKAEQAKKTVTSALIGFVIVFASYWIVKLIGVVTDLPNIL